MIRVAVLGATGRMGVRTLALLRRDHRFETVAVLTATDDPELGNVVDVSKERLSIADTCDVPFDVLIDFSVPRGTMNWLEHCERTTSAMVSGVTGHTPEQRVRFATAAKRIAFLHASNFSLGVNLLLSMAAEAARRLGEAYDIEIIEHHHNRKIDAPSGTAVSLVQAIVEATGRNADRDVVYGRHGETGVRPKGQIGVHAVRMGSLVGHHEVHFAGPEEHVTLSHTSSSRDAFARGALEAAAWIVLQRPGLYGMSDVLADGLRGSEAGR